MGIQGVLENLTGHKFGRLLVVSRAENTKRGTARWVCLCECGNRSVVQASNLKSGGTRSCGCLRQEVTRRSRLKYEDSHCREPGCGERPFARDLCKPHYERVKGIERRGISLAEYGRLLEEQDHQCAICREGFRDRTPFVDHDHSCCPGRDGCGKCVRGLLCVGCNMGLGGFRDRPSLMASAIEYLEAAA